MSFPHDILSKATMVIHKTLGGMAHELYSLCGLRSCVLLGDEEYVIGRSVYFALPRFWATATIGPCGRMRDLIRSKFAIDGSHSAEGLFLNRGVGNWRHLNNAEALVPIFQAAMPYLFWKLSVSTSGNLTGDFESVLYVRCFATPEGSQIIRFFAMRRETVLVELDHACEPLWVWLCITRALGQFFVGLTVRNMTHSTRRRGCPRDEPLLRSVNIDPDTMIEPARAASRFLSSVVW
jgi:hypothetical protein